MNTIKLLKSHKRGQILRLELFFSGHQEKSTAHHSTKSKFGTSQRTNVSSMEKNKYKLSGTFEAIRFSCLSD